MIEREEVKVGDRLTIHRNGYRVEIDRVTYITPGKARVYHTGGPTSLLPTDAIELVDREDPN